MTTEYPKTTWINQTGEAISSANLNKMEQGIKNATDGVIAIEANPYALPPADELNLGGVKIEVDATDPNNIIGRIFV